MTLLGVMLLLAITVLLVYGLSGDEEENDKTSSRPDDFRVEYHWSAGSLPPPHHYAYTVTIEPSGRAELVMRQGYGDDAPHWTETFTIALEELDALHGKMVENGLFTHVWRQMEHPPAGGSTQWLVVTADGKRVEVPPFPVQEAATEAMCSAVRSLIPKRIRKTLNARRENY